MKERRSNFDDTAEVWAGDVKLLDDADFRLTGYVDLIDVPTMGKQDGATSWDGYIDGLSEHQTFGAARQETRDATVEPSNRNGVLQGL
jgi:hypothetical protein